MTVDVFGSVYARLYDHLYCDKDYDAECDLLETIFRRYGRSEVKAILDIGCGTGSHALLLAQRGYAVTGVDRSKEMLAVARAKVESAGLSVELRQADVCVLNLGRSFDAVLMMFATLGYQTQNSEVAAALATARRHLRPGGLLLIDVWYGPAVLAQRPTERIKVIPTDGGFILRAASGELDVRRHTCLVCYRLWHLEADRLVAEASEEHEMRYFFPLELEQFLETAGFALAHLSAFPKFDREPDESTWNVIAVAIAR